jgi:hypothetical protein
LTGFLQTASKRRADALRGVRSHHFVPEADAPMEQNELRHISWYLDEISRAN